MLQRTYAVVPRQLVMPAVAIQSAPSPSLGPSVSSVTNVDVLCQQVVASGVLFKDIEVRSNGAEGRPCQKAEEPAITSQRLYSLQLLVFDIAYPPRNAPTGLLAGSALTGVSNRRAEV